MPMQINLRTTVNSKAIRRETHNGRDHMVIPSYTLPANVVMNGGLYPASEIDEHFQKLEGTLAPMGHPTVNGAFVSAFSPEGINTGHVGAWNRNVKKSGNRVYAEKWLDVEVANQSANGKRLIERLEALERGDDVPPIHTSVALFLEQMPAPQGTTGYDWIAKINSIDHDAILLDEVGAATPEKGVGLMVNTESATPFTVNSGALIGETYREREHRIEAAAKTKFATGPDEYVWVADFTDTQVVIMRNGGIAEIFGYKIESGQVVFDDSGVSVERRESWIVKVNQFFKSFTFRPNAELPKGAPDMPITAEERAEIVRDVSASVAEAIKPIGAAVATLQANQTALSDQLTASTRAEETTLRATVAAKFGEVVANSLSGAPLAEMARQCGTATPIGNSQAAAPAAADFSKTAA